MEKLSMGEYTLIVWAAYGCAAIVLGGCLALSISALRKAQKRLKDVS